MHLDAINIGLWSKKFKAFQARQSLLRREKVRFYHDKKRVRAIYPGKIATINRRLPYFWSNLLRAQILKPIFGRLLDAGRVPQRRFLPTIYMS